MPYKGLHFEVISENIPILIRKRGSEVHSAKLSEDIVSIIKQKYNEGVSQKALADEFNVSQPLIRQIKLEVAWSHVLPKIIDRPHPKKYYKLKEEDVVIIKSLIGKESFGLIADRFGINETTVANIKSGKIWKSIDVPVDRDSIPILRKPHNTPTILTKEQVIEIKTLYNQGVSVGDLGRKFNVVSSNISQIILGKIWKEVGPEITTKNPPKYQKLDETKVKEIKTLLLAGWEQEKIAKKFSVCRPLISNIKSGKSWSQVTIDG